MLAWLHSAPKTHEKETKPAARIKSLSKDDQAMHFPETDEHITKCFNLMGICTNGGMGILAITWSDIWYFCEKSAYQLNGWESEQIVIMSNAYVSMYNKATSNINCKPPYRQSETKEEELQRDRDIIGAKMLMVLKGK